MIGGMRSREGRYTRLFAWIPNTKLGSAFVRNVWVPIDKAIYRRTGGRRGLSPKQTMCWLTTTGARTGQPRAVPVLYLREGSTFWVMASNFGREHHPAWSFNLLKNPDAILTIGDEKLDVRARPGTAADKERLWPQLLELYPAWRQYVKWTDRDFRLFALEPWKTSA